MEVLTPQKISPWHQRRDEICTHNDTKPNVMDLSSVTADNKNFCIILPSKKDKNLISTT